MSASLILHIERHLCLFCFGTMGQKEKTPSQISDDMIRAITLRTKALGCLFSGWWQGNIFVHSIMPKVQETQGADGGEKAGGEKKKKPGIERTDIRRSGLDNMHLDKCPDCGLRVSHSLLGAISQYPCPSLEQNAAQK